MKALSLTVDGERGYLFEATDNQDTIAFVPQGVLSDWQHAEDGFDPAGYLVSGWAAKNARFNSGETGKHAFPVIDHPVNNADEHRVTVFLQRLRHAYSVELAS